MNQTIDYRTAAYMNDISPVKLLEKLRDTGVIYDRGPQRNQPKPGFTHLFDTEHTEFKCGTRYKPHEVLLIRPAGQDYIRAMLKGDKEHARRLTFFRVNRTKAHAKMAEITAQLSH